MFRRLSTASAHSRGQMQFGCHQRTYFWTFVACKSIIHAFDNYVPVIIVIFPPFHLHWNSARLYYQRGEDTIQDDSITHLVKLLVLMAFMRYICQKNKAAAFEIKTMSSCKGFGNESEIQETMISCSSCQRRSNAFWHKDRMTKTLKQNMSKNAQI